MVNFSALRRRAFMVVRAYLVLSLICGVMYWWLNPMGLKNITHYMFDEGLHNWINNSLHNLLLIWFGYTLRHCYYPK